MIKNIISELKKMDPFPRNYFIFLAATAVIAFVAACTIGIAQYV